jgi:TrmH family RNA methyltransferase
MREKYCTLNVYFCRADDDMPQKITSIKNPRIKELLDLQSKPAARRKHKLFIVEGRKEIFRAAGAGYRLVSLWYCPDIGEGAYLDEILVAFQPGELIEVTPAVYAKIAYRGSTEGLVAVASTRELHLDNIRLGPNPLILVAEAIEKPGNLGALLRSADAAGVDAVLVGDPLVDLYNPNVVRSSIGTLFTSQVVADSTGNIIAWLREKGICIYATALSASVCYDEVDYTIPCALVMGTEATGLTPAWLEASDKNIIIPMRGNADSLNVSVTAAIVLFEACRQRRRN